MVLYYCSCIYKFSYKEGNQLYTADLLLEFNNEELCSISSLTDGVTAKGNGLWSDDTEKIYRETTTTDGMELNYIITFDNGKTFSVREKLAWVGTGQTEYVSFYSPILFY